MSKQYDPEDPAEMDKWTRAYFKIKNDEATDAYLVRTGVTADTPDGFAKRMNMALAWLWPHLTLRTQPLYDQIREIVEGYHQKFSLIARFYEPGQKYVPRTEPTELDGAKCEKAMLLFEQAKELRRMDVSVAAQEAFRQAQSARASKPRKLSEAACERIAKRYCESKTNGTGYGIAKALAAEYDVSATTIHATARTYKPLN